jgi:hypothetical protein
MVPFLQPEQGPLHAEQFGIVEDWRNAPETPVLCYNLVQAGKLSCNGFESRISGVFSRLK